MTVSGGRQCIIFSPLKGHLRRHLFLIIIIQEGTSTTPPTPSGCNVFSYLLCLFTASFSVIPSLHKLWISPCFRCYQSLIHEIFSTCSIIKMPLTGRSDLEVTLPDLCVAEEERHCSSSSGGKKWQLSQGKAGVRGNMLININQHQH